MPEGLRTRETMKAGADGDGLVGGREVAAWLDFERNTTRLERTVNHKITLATRKQLESQAQEARTFRRQASTEYWQGDYDASAVHHQDATPSTTEGVKRGRVTFERGWDAWWIQEAVDDFTII